MFLINIQISYNFLNNEKKFYFLDNSLVSMEIKLSYNNLNMCIKNMSDTNVYKKNMQNINKIITEKFQPNQLSYNFSKFFSI